MSADHVLECGGVKARKGDGERLNITIDEFSGSGHVRFLSLYSDVFLTPNEARRLAQQLRRFARRIDERAGQQP